MSIPEGWNLKTPALASRRGSRGIPTPFYIVAILMMGGVPLLTYGRMNWYVAVGIGFTVGGGLLFAVFKFSRSMGDRDWFEILKDWLSIKITLASLSAWERFHKW